VSGGLTNRQTGEMYRTALAVAVANDKIVRRYSALAERLADAIAERQDRRGSPAGSTNAACASVPADASTWGSPRPRRSCAVAPARLALIAQ
jgi:hypothetical protein